MRHAALSATVFFVLSALAGCSPDQGTASAPTEAATTPPAATGAAGPQLAVKADKTHAVQPNDQVTVTVSVADFTLDASKMGQANESGTGHYRVYLDGSGGDDYLAAGADPTITVQIPADITDGSHDLRVVLHNNDYTPLDPAIEQSVLLIVYRL